MAQYEIELILIRQLAMHLSMPMFIVDAQGTLVFFNEPAETILGRRFEEHDEMPMDEWGQLWHPASAEGEKLDFRALPLSVAVLERRPVYDSFWITGMDQVRRYIHVVAFPLVGQAHRFVGAAALYWEGDAG